MLLPQSSAFAALKNRLNSVSSIGYLHIAPRPYVSSTGSAASAPHSRQGSVVEAIQSLQQQQLQVPRTSKFSLETHAPTYSSSTAPSGPNFDRPNRLKGREEGIIRWNELLEKFRSVQERARRAQRLLNGGDAGGGSSLLDDGSPFGLGSDFRVGEGLPESRGPKDAAAGRATGGGPSGQLKEAPAAAAPPVKPKSSLGRQFGRLGGAVSGRGKRAQQ